MCQEGSGKPCCSPRPVGLNERVAQRHHQKRASQEVGQNLDLGSAAAGYGPERHKDEGLSHHHRKDEINYTAAGKKSRHVPANGALSRTTDQLRIATIDTQAR